jgi:hypothetical protein
MNPKKWVRKIKVDQVYKLAIALAAFFIASSVYLIWSIQQDLPDPPPKQTPFDRTVWLMSDPEGFNSPRWGMTDNLISSYLEPGLHRKRILNLLGEPERVIIQYQMKDKESDSLFKKSDAMNFRGLDSLGVEYGHPDTLMLYSIGLVGHRSSPDYLYIQVDGYGRVIESYTK